MPRGLQLVCVHSLHASEDVAGKVCVHFNAVCGSQRHLGLSKRNHHTLQADTVGDRPCLLHLQFLPGLSSTVEGAISLCTRRRRHPIASEIHSSLQPACPSLGDVQLTIIAPLEGDRDYRPAHTSPKVAALPLEKDVCSCVCLHTKVQYDSMLSCDCSTPLDLLLTRSVMISQHRHRIRNTACVAAETTVVSTG